MLVFGWMGFNPGSTLGATDLRIGLVAVNTLLVGVRRLRHGDEHRPTPSTASPTSRCRATACSPVSSRSPRRARSSRRGRRSIIGGDRRRARRATASSSSTASPRRRPVRRDLGARRERRVGRARGRPVRRRHLRRRLERRRRDGPRRAGPLLRRRRPARSRRSFHVVVGFVWAWGITWIIFTVAKRFMQIRVSPEVGDPGPRRARVRRARATPTSCSTHAGGRPCHAPTPTSSSAPVGSGPGRPE